MNTNIFLCTWYAKCSFWFTLIVQNLVPDSAEV